MRFSPRVDLLRGEGAGAWTIHSAASAALRAGEDVVVMSIGDPDFATPDEIAETAIRALRAGDTHYADIAGRPRLREAIARETMRLGGPDATPDNVIVLAGAQNALFSASLCLFSPGDEVIALEPVYVTYAASVEVSGAKLVRVPANREAGFRPDLAAIERAVTPATRGLLFSNPNNPSGVILTVDELAGLAALARRHDLWVISDEVYAALAFEAEHRCIAALPGMAERTVTVGSLSKSQAMTGWRMGWMVAPRELIGHVEDLALCMLYGLPGFVQEAAVTALTEARGEMDRMHDVYRARRDLVLSELSAAPNLRAFAPQAGMFSLVDVRGTPLSAIDFAWGLFREEGVSVLDGGAFGASTAGTVRLSYTLGEEMLREGCRRIRRFAERLGAPRAARAAG
jgi:arginine:pyruvate transaminase